MRRDQRQRRWRRFARLVVLCLAFFLARPTTTAFADTVDRVVLVAGQVEARSAERSEQRRQVESDNDAWTEPPLFSAAGEGATTRVLAAVQSPRVFVERKYLRHCSLLR